jgi:hypothetical protein
MRPWRKQAGQAHAGWKFTILTEADISWNTKTGRGTTSTTCPEIGRTDMEEARQASVQEAEQFFRERAHQYDHMDKAEFCSMCLIKRPLVLDVEGE